VGWVYPAEGGGGLYPLFEGGLYPGLGLGLYGAGGG